MAALLFSGFKKTLIICNLCPMNTLKIFILFFFLLMARHTLHAQQQHNYDENKVPDYVLPPLLQGADRNTIKTTQQWER